MQNSHIEKSLESIKNRVTQAALAARREPHEIEILAVSKKHSVEAIQYVHKLGVSNFGENYVQEMAHKAAALEGLALKWVFIGQIQSNKIKQMVPYAGEVQTLASLRHAEKFAQELNKQRRAPLPVYLAVRLPGDLLHSGVSFDEIPKLSDQIRALPQLMLRGLFCIPPAELSRSCVGMPLGECPPVYRELKKMALEVGEGKLSLGMSGDFEAAIAAGSDCVRIGSQIFGDRL